MTDQMIDAAASSDARLVGYRLSMPPGQFISGNADGVTLGVIGHVSINGKVICQGATWDAETPRFEIAKRAFDAGIEYHRFHTSPRYWPARLRLWWSMRFGPRIRFTHGFR